jgi:hypothetical protein
MTVPLPRSRRGHRFLAQAQLVWLLSADVLEAGVLEAGSSIVGTTML